MSELKLYHGTSREAAQKILDERRFKVSRNFGDWLGPGVYFFENSPLKALAWTQIKGWIPNCTADASPVVLETTIDSDECFDLFKTENIQLLKSIARMAEAEGIVAPEQSQKAPVLKDHNGTRRRIPSGSKVSHDRYEFANIFDEKLVVLTLAALKEHDGRIFRAVRFPFWEGRQVRKGSYFFDHTNVQVCIFDYSAIPEYSSMKPMEDKPETDSRFLNFDKMGLASEPKLFDTSHVQRSLTKLDIPV